MTRGGRSRTGRLLGAIVAAFLAITAAGMASAAEKVTIATGQDFSPFEFVDADGKPAGLVVDLWKLWSEKTGIAVEFAPAPWAKTLDMVRDGRADIHAGLNITEERQKFLDYGDSLLSTNSYVFSPVGIELSGGVSDLVGFRVGVLKGSLEESLIRERAPGAEVVPFDGIGALYDAIAAKEIRLFADVEQTGLYFLGKRDLVPAFRYDAARPLDANYLFAAVTKGKKALLEQVNEGLRRITANERAQITRRWLAPVEGRTTDTLVIAISRNYPPFTLIDANGQAAGMLVDIWRLWSEKTGRRVTFRQSSWADTLYALRNGEADIHSGLFHSAERAEWMAFSRPVYEITSRLYHRTGEVPPADLAGKKIGAGFGYYQETFLRKNHPDANVVTFGDDEELIRGLSKGEVEAFLSEDPTVEALLDRMGLRGRITSTGRPLLRNELYFGVRKDDVDLLAEIEAGLDAIEAEQLAAIERRWVLNPEKRFLSVGPVSLSAGERGWIADNATLRVGTVPQGEALIRVEAEEPKGYAVDILKRVADKVGLGFEFIHHASSDDVMAAFRAGDIDIVPLAVKTPAQERLMAFTRPHVADPTVMVTRSAAGLDGIADLDGKSLAVVAASPVRDAIHAGYPEVAVTEVANLPAGLEAVRHARVDAFIGGRAAIERALKKQPVKGLQVVGPSGIDEAHGLKLHLGARKDNAVLLSVLDKGMAALSPDELKALRGRWFSDTAPAKSEALSLTDGERAWIAANPRIRVHNETDWPPFNFAEDGRPKGFSIDFMDLVAERVGLRVDYVTGPSWNEFLEMMKSGDLDVMLNIVKTPDRQTYMIYTRPYLDNPNTILSRRDKSYDNLEQLFGKTISVPKGFFYEEILKRDYPQIKLHLVKGSIESMKAVSFGKADAALGELAVFNHLLAQHMMTDLVVSGEVKMGDPEYALLNIAARQDLPLLGSILDKGVKSVGVEEVRAIQRKWLGDTQTAGGRRADLGLTDAEKAWLVEHREIRLGVDPAYPPFDFIAEDGTHSGMAADYVKLIGERLGLTMKLVPDLSWSQVLAGAKAKNIDILPAVTADPQRETYLNFTRPHITHPTIIITRDDFPFISGLQDLGDRPFAMVKGYATTAQVKGDFPDLVPHEVETPLAALQAVSNGRADGTAMNLGVASYLIRKHNLSNLKLAAPTDVVDSGLAIGVRKDWPELVTIIDKVLATLTADEINAIQNRWVAVQYEPGVDLTLVLQIGGGVAVVVLLVILWNRRLRREVEERRKVEDAQRTILEAISLPIVVVRQDNGEIRYINEAAAAGRAHEAMIGSDARDLYLVPSDRRAFLKTMEGQGKVDAFEVQFRDSDTESIWALMSSRGIVFEGHSSFLTTWTDITANKRAEAALQESERRFASMLNDSPFGVILVRQPGRRLVFANKRFYEMFGVDEEGLKDFGPAKYFANPADLDMVTERLRKDRQIRDVELLFKRVDGKEFWASASYMMLDYMDEPANLGWYYDVTDRKRAEEILRTAKEEAEAADQSKSDFIAVVSHEVRTPMNGVLGMARLMLETALNEEQQDYAQTIVDSGEALLTILNDLLDISKLEAGKLEMEARPFVPRRLFEDTVNVMRSRAREKGLSLHCAVDHGVPEALIGDANRLRQIALNLLSNAIKFTDRGGVTVVIDGYADASGRFALTLSVTDTGVGIPSDEADQLFTPYVQATVDIARRYGGTGLGLSICRQLAELMGGAITLDSTIGRGSTFTLAVTLDVTDAAPVEARDLDLATQSEAEESAGPVLRILLVEDNLINQKVALGMLGKLGHDIVVAENGRESLDRMDDDGPFDIILMDRHMPVMDGIEATVRIRAMDDRRAETPIVALTAAVTQREIQTCLDAGMNGVVTKPIDSSELQTVINQVTATRTDSTRPTRAAATVVSPPDAVPAGQEIDEEPVLDPATLDRLRADYGDDIVAEFAEDFRGIGRDGVDAFQRAAEAGDLEPMTRHAHDLKGSAATLGLTRFAALCRSIEIACKEERIEDARAVGTGLEEGLGEALRALVAADGAAPAGGDEAGEVDEARARFLAKMSHDLRNSMNTMLGYILMLHDCAEQPCPPEELEDYAFQIQKAGDHLRAMTGDVLTLFQLEAGHYELSRQHLDAEKLARECVDAAQPAAGDRKVTISVEGAEGFPPFIADAEALRHMMGDLLDNAVQVSSEGAVVRLAFATDNGSATILVADDGPGMSPDEIAKARIPYDKVWEGNSQKSLTGLRLAVVDQLVALHDGRLEIESAPGQGTTATLVFPRCF